MTETTVGHLYKMSALLEKDSGDINKQHLASNYLLKCHEITKSFGLPTRQFSNKKRCFHCCTEWKHGGYETKINPIKLSKRQRYKQRQKLMADNTAAKETNLLNCNQLERLCLLCKKVTVINLEKPEKSTNKTIESSIKITEPNKVKAKNKAVTSGFHTNTAITKEINVYSNIKEAFSIKNQNNLLASTVKEPPKVIKNNKKKKDKFAGLCKEAVLSASKLKDKEFKKNKLNLFLKPSS